MTGWIFQATPQDFDIDAFVKLKPAKAKWRASAPGMERKCRVGDRVFLWLAKGKDESRFAGVVAEGAVCGPVSDQVDDSAAACFWMDRSAARLVEARVEVILTRFALPDEIVRRDELKDDPVLGRMALMRAGIGTNFALTEEQEGRLSRLWAGGHRKWQHADLVVALAFYPKADDTGLALAQGRYVSACRKVLASFQDCDSATTRRSTLPRAAIAAAWNEVFGSGREDVPLPVLV